MSFLENRHGSLSRIGVEQAHRALTEQKAALASRFKNQGIQLEEAQIETVERLMRVAGLRHDNFQRHNQRVAHIAMMIAREVGSATPGIVLGRAAALHDIGKIGIPDSILLKPGPLSEAEWVTMKTHTTIGGAILSGGTSAFMLLAEEIAMSHHERWDGLGYPQGLRGDAIPLPARIVSIADVFDALSSDRPYRRAFTVEESCLAINRGSGTLFDPTLVKVFNGVIEQRNRMPSSSEKHSDDEPFSLQN